MHPGLKAADKGISELLPFSQLASLAASVNG